MNKGHGRGRGKHHTVELTEVCKVDTQKLHRRAIFSIPGHIHADLTGKHIAWLPVNG